MIPSQNSRRVASTRASSRRFRRLRLGFAVAASLTVLAGCAQPEDVAPPAEAGGTDAQTCSARGIGCSPELVSAAEEAALKAADGNAQLGGEIKMLTNGSGDEALQNMFKPFSDATGVKLTLTEVPGTISVLGPQIASGNIPDLLWDSTLGHLREFESHLQPIEDVIGEDVVQNTMNPTLAQFVTKNGHLYAVPVNTQTFSVYYHPDLYQGPTDEPTWDELLSWGVGNKPEDRGLFCITANDGGFSGNKEAQLMDGLLLQQHGPDMLRGLVDGTVKWNTPEVAETFNSYLDVYKDGLNYGGLEVALTSPDDDAAALFSDDPPKCDLANNGPWMSGFVQNVRPEYEQGVDYANFFLGSDNPAWGPEGALPHNGGGHLFAFKLTPQTEAFIRYTASTEFQTLMASTGNWIVMNKQVDPTVYPNEIMEGIYDKLTAAKELVVSPFGGLPPSIRDIYVKSVFASMQDPATVPQNLQAIDDAVATYQPTG